MMESARISVYLVKKSSCPFRFCDFPENLRTFRLRGKLVFHDPVAVVGAPLNIFGRLISGKRFEEKASVDQVLKMKIGLRNCVSF